MNKYIIYIIQIISNKIFREVNMNLNEEKMKEVIHYIVSKCSCNGNLWRTTLYKVLYFSDFNYYELHDQPITNEDYAKYPNGPIPTHFINLKNELIKEKKIQETHKYPFKGAYYKGYNYTLISPPEINLLNEKEIKVIDTVINKLKDMNTDQISNYSHGDIPWIVAENHAIMDYRYVFYRDAKYSVRDYDEQV